MADIETVNREAQTSTLNLSEDSYIDTHMALCPSEKAIVKIELQPKEIQIARELWEDLRHGVEGAHDNLREVPHQVRTAILRALVIAMNTRSTINPFH